MVSKKLTHAAVEDDCGGGKEAFTTDRGAAQNNTALQQAPTRSGGEAATDRVIAAMGLTLAATRGQVPSGATPTVTVGCWRGRFGSAIVQLGHAFVYAIATGTREVHLPGKRAFGLLEFGSGGVVPVQHANLSRDRAWACPLPAEILYCFLRMKCRGATSTEYHAVAQANIRPLLVRPLLQCAENPAPIDDGMLSIHLRSEDIWNDMDRKAFAHAWHQPPCAMYRKIILEQGFKRILVVTTPDRKNPALHCLQSLVEEHALGLTVQTKSTLEDFCTLLRARNLVVAHSSFSQAAAHLSKVVRRLYYRDWSHHSPLGNSIPPGNSWLLEYGEECHMLPGIAGFSYRTEFRNDGKKSWIPDGFEDSLPGVTSFIMNFSSADITMRRCGEANAPKATPAEGLPQEHASPGQKQPGRRATGMAAAVQIGQAPEVVFFAGVEGSGHHFLEAVMRKVPHNDVRTRGGWWYPGNNWTLSDFWPNVRELSALKPGTVNVLPQQMSYPMGCLGNHEARCGRCFPRLDLLASAAREAGVRLKVILLHRDLGDCLAADCLHRHFEPCAAQAETLVRNADTIASQLAGLHPDQIACLRYGQPESMAQALQDAFGGAVPSDLVDELWRDSPPRHMREQVPDWSSLAGKLRVSEGQLEAACRNSMQQSLAAVIQHAREGAT